MGHLLIMVNVVGASISANTNQWILNYLLKHILEDSVLLVDKVIPKPAMQMQPGLAFKEIVNCHLGHYCQNFICTGDIVKFTENTLLGIPFIYVN